MVTHDEEVADTVELTPQLIDLQRSILAREIAALDYTASTMTIEARDNPDLRAAIVQLAARFRRRVVNGQDVTPEPVPA